MASFVGGVSLDGSAPPVAVRYLVRGRFEGLPPLPVCLFRALAPKARVAARGGLALRLIVLHLLTFLIS